VGAESSEPSPRLITVSASYGTGGSVVAPALAERLGLPFLQRVTTSEGHPAEPGPCDEQLTEEELKATPIHRLFASFTHAMPVGPTVSPPSAHHQDQHLRGNGEAGILRLMAGGGGVILGRAAAVVLGKDRGFHVRLDGPASRRVVQGAVVEGISDPADPALYHLVIDSTAVPLDTVIELVLAAARAHAGTPEGATARS
jgi:hypothetical protein